MDLVLNWDHTGVNIVPGSQWTMTEKGSKRVACAGVDDKRQITIVVCIQQVVFFAFSGNS